LFCQNFIINYEFILHNGLLSLFFYFNFLNEFDWNEILQHQPRNASAPTTDPQKENRSTQAFGGLHLTNYVRIAELVAR